MNKKGFTNIKDIDDEYIVWRGASFLFLPTKKGLEVGASCSSRLMSTA